jgi:hypothetical protein
MTMILSISAFYILSTLLLSAHAVTAQNGDVPPPPGGLESNSNYIFINKNTSNILDLITTIRITEALHVSSTGVSFQLLGLSNTSSELVPQEFGISFDGTNFRGFINTFNLALPRKLKTRNEVFSDNTTLATDDTHQGFIPAGTIFTITLINDGDGAVTNAQFGISQGETGIDVAEGIEITGSTAPIVSFMFVIVGVGNGLRGQFTSGNGTVEYSATTSFRPVNRATNAIGFPFSANPPETGNSVYGGLSGSEVTDLTQTWQVQQLAI